MSWLPVDVGEAIAVYCRDGRRNGGCRTLFVSSLAPWDGLSPSGIGQVVARGPDVTAAEGIASLT